MKKFLFLFVLLASFDSYAQNFYSTAVAKGTYTTYQCSTLVDTFRVISNQINTKVWTPLRFKDGQEVGPDAYKCIVSNDPNRQLLYKIIRDSFATEQLNKFRQNGESLDIDLVIEPDGRISEVAFAFRIHSNLTRIHPDVYYQIEQKIKSQIRYTWDQKTRTLYPWVPTNLRIRFGKDL